MFRFHMHALRFTRLQTKITNLQKSHPTRTDRHVLQIPSHFRPRTQPLVFKPSHSTTLFACTPKTIPAPLVSARK